MYDVIAHIFARNDGVGSPTSRIISFVLFPYLVLLLVGYTSRIQFVKLMHPKFEIYCLPSFYI